MQRNPRRPFGRIPAESTRTRVHTGAQRRYARQPIESSRMSALIARRCFVSGLVQGVFFRASTRQRANELNVTGHAINLPDGRVEVVAVGDPPAVHQLIEWLHRGPPSARVERVDVQEMQVAELAKTPAAFTTK